jgi:hypothetical protein
VAKAPGRELPAIGGGPSQERDRGTEAGGLVATTG